MPTYQYKALGEGNVASEGTITAASRREALQRLIAGGHRPLDLREETYRQSGNASGFTFRRRPIRLATFTRQLATLSASGTPMVKGLTVLSEQLNEPRAREILRQVCESVQGGSTFADALDQHPNTFPKLMTSMVRVGETGGTLDEQLTQLSELYEKEEALKGEVQAAVAYPVLVLVLGLVSAFVLVTLFIPRLEVMFEDIGEALPLPTRILLGLSHFLTERYLVLVGGILLAMFGARWALNDPRVRLSVDRIKLRVPWVGTLLGNLEIARFTRLLGTLTRAGVSIVEAMAIVQPALGNAAIASAVRDMTARLRTGERLAVLMRKSRLFPPLSVQMVATGEETGHLDQMLVRLADAYDRETTAATKVVTSLLAPALILAVAAVVGFILASIMLPIFQLSTVMR